MLTHTDQEEVIDIGSKIPLCWLLRRLFQCLTSRDACGWWPVQKVHQIPWLAWESIAIKDASSSDCKRLESQKCSKDSFQGPQWSGQSQLIVLRQQHCNLKNCQQWWAPGVGHRFDGFALCNGPPSPRPTVQLFLGRAGPARSSSVCILNIESFAWCPVYGGGYVACLVQWSVQAAKVAAWAVQAQSTAWFQSVSSENGSSPWEPIGVTQMVPLAAVIFFYSWWPQRGKSLICHSVIFQVADQMARTLSTAQTRVSKNITSFVKEYWLEPWGQLWVLPTEQRDHICFLFQVDGADAEQPQRGVYPVDTMGFSLAEPSANQAQAFRRTTAEWKPHWASDFASGCGMEDNISPKGMAVCLSCKAENPTGARPAGDLNTPFPSDKGGLLGPPHTVSYWVPVTLPLKISVTRPLCVFNTLGCSLLTRTQEQGKRCFSKEVYLLASLGRQQTPSMDAPPGEAASQMFWSEKWSIRKIFSSKGS